MKTSVSFKSDNWNLIRDFRMPNNYKKDEKRAAIVVIHPFGGVKEQTAGLYAEKLSEMGFITLAFDASHQGEIEGMPRFLEDPARTPRAQHPNSPNLYMFKSLDKIVAYSSFDRAHLISPHPMLLIAGTKADTLYFSELAYKQAKDPKELF
ncbi:alpha/beta hydrolase [Bacillus thuringiensis]|nr:alpha/beta hydrolase [Bacillus thuringiensis]